MIPHHVLFVEVFGGGASFLLEKPKSKLEVYNDINGDLVNLFMVVRDNFTEFSNRLDFLLNSREIYEKWVYEFNNGLGPDDSVERAVRYYYCICLAFAGKWAGGWAGVGNSRRFNVSSRLPFLKIIHKRLQGVSIDCKDYKDILRNRDSEDTFFFLDPPYLNTTGYRGTDRFNIREHKELASYIKKIKGKWMLTVNDHPLMKELYKEYNFYEINQNLSSYKSEDGEARPSFTNLVFYNYDLKKSSQSILGNYLMNHVAIPVINENGVENKND